MRRIFHRFTLNRCKNVYPEQILLHFLFFFCPTFLQAFLPDRVWLKNTLAWNKQWDSASVVVSNIDSFGWLFTLGSTSFSVLSIIALLAGGNNLFVFWRFRGDRFALQNARIWSWLVFVVRGWKHSSKLATFRKL